MKKILGYLSAMLLLFVVTTSCNNSMSGLGPKETLVAFFEKLSKKDIEGAAKYATKDSKSTLDMMKKGMDMAEKMKDQSTDADKDPAEEFKSMEVGEAKIDGEVATVAVKNKKKDTEVEFPLKKEGGAWKVDFSMATLMKMGMDERKKHGGDETMDADSDVNHINPEEMQKGMQMADSMLKNMDPEKLKEASKALEKLKENK